MQKYRKSDQYYIDEYDRLTIEELKAVEQQVAADPNYDSFKDDIDPEFRREVGLKIRLNEAGTKAAHHKRLVLNSWMQRDERKDRLVLRHELPDEPYCLICKALMTFADHDFINGDTELLYIFSCTKASHNKILYPDGSEYRIPDKYCPYCNGKIHSTVKKSKLKITCTDNCTLCTWSEVIVLNRVIKADKIQPINEKEREQYCTDFKHRRTFLESLQAIASIGGKLGINTKQIRMLKLPQVEELLKKATENKGFIKFQFDVPKITSQVNVRFSIQDPVDREREKSILTLKKVITQELLPTNWRLMHTDIIYRLGYLEGQIKGVDQQEDLEKIVKEIEKKQGGKNCNS